MKIRKTIVYIFYCIYSRLARSKFSKEAYSNAGALLLLPFGAGLALVVFVYQKIYGNIFKLPAAATFLAIGSFAVISCTMLYLFVFRNIDETKLSDSDFPEPCYQGWSGRIIMIIYMSMIVWAPLFAWFLFKYVI